MEDAAERMRTVADPVCQADGCEQRMVIRLKKSSADTPCPRRICLCHAVPPTYLCGLLSVCLQVPHHIFAEFVQEQRDSGAAFDTALDLMFSRLCVDGDSSGQGQQFCT